VAWKEPGAISRSLRHHAQPLYLLRKPASKVPRVTAQRWHRTCRAPTNPGDHGPVPSESKGGVSASSHAIHLGGGPAATEGDGDLPRSWPWHPVHRGQGDGGTGLVPLQAPGQGRRPPGPPAARGVGAHLRLPHSHCPVLSKWPPLAGARGSSHRGVWPPVPSCPHPRQPGRAWPGPACSCGGGGGCRRTRAGRSTPPPTARSGS